MSRDEQKTNEDILRKSLHNSNLTLATLAFISALEKEDLRLKRVVFKRQPVAPSPKYLGSLAGVELTEE